VIRLKDVDLVGETPEDPLAEGPGVVFGCVFLGSERNLVLDLEVLIAPLVAAADDPVAPPVEPPTDTTTGTDLGRRLDETAR
jgi:hypothetical protein